MIFIGVSTAASSNGDTSGLIEATLFASLLLTWWFLEHSGYKFGYCDEGICSRMAGLIWKPLPRRLPFAEVKSSEIVAIKKVFHGNAQAKRNFYAYDYLGVEGSNGEMVVLYPDGMRREDFRKMLKKIFKKDRMSS